MIAFSFLTCYTAGVLNCFLPLGPSGVLPPGGPLRITLITLFEENSKEPVRKIRKNGVENTARDLSICDNLVNSDHKLHKQ